MARYGARLPAKEPSGTAVMISIIICTRNRADSLRETLAAIGQCDVPSDLPTELLVVDNGSTDHTRAIIDAAKLPNISVRHVFESRAGQCHARNRGLAESTGQVILFTDDDIRPPKNWIDGMCRPILSGKSDAVAGGVVFPQRHEATLSAEPYRRYRGWFATTEKVDPANPDRMVGANMAFGRHVLSDVPEFDVKLGPGALGFGDETLFSAQLLARGYRLISAMDVAVEHHFDLSRLDRRSMLDIAERMGRSEAYLAWHWRHEDHPCTTGKSLRRHAGLWRRRMMNLPRWISGREPIPWEMDRVREIAFRRQFAVESRESRRYQRNQIAPRSVAAA